MNYLMTDTEGQNKQMEFAGQFLGKFNIKASMVNKGHTSTELGIKSSKAQVESRNKICIPALGDDGVPEL
jgi:hypothetical protein